MIIAIVCYLIVGLIWCWIFRKHMINSRTICANVLFWWVAAIVVLSHAYEDSKHAREYNKEHGDNK